MLEPAVDLQYGEHPDQVVQWYRSAAPRGSIVLIHGGYWREKFTLDLMTPLAEKFQTDGWYVFNVEYRRGAAASFAELSADIRAAFAAIQDTGAGAHPIFSIGHSVGGQLALLNAASVDAVVALAPVTDVVRTRDEGLGEDAVLEFFGPEQARQDAILHDASPLMKLPASRYVPILLVHGRNDARVPISHHESYLRAAAEADAHVDALTLADCSHLDLIDPTAAHWPLVGAWLAPMTVPPARSSR